MALINQAQVNELLLEREELFVRIHLAEKRAAELLGEAYPFERPSLPSDQKGKRKPVAPRVRDSILTKPIQVRALAKGEACYRLSYEQWGRLQEEIHHEASALGLLLSCQTKELRVVRIESLDTSGDLVAVLFQGEEARSEKREARSEE